MSVFDKRVNFKPFEYPEAVQYKEAINHSYWLHTEWNFSSDVQDYRVKLNDTERAAVKNTILAISQIEVSVKKFWTKLGERFPKAEFDQVGVTFGESEVRHSDAYSHLLHVLGFNGDFEGLVNNPVIKGRVDYLTKYIQSPSKVETDEDRRAYTITLALFSLFVENVSLFSQFAVIKAFNRHKNVLKDIDNVIQATIQEERIHAQFGVYLIKLIMSEFPEWFGPEFEKLLKKSCKKAFVAESKIIDWIFQDGELSFLSKDALKAFLAKRFNDSLADLGYDAIFDVDPVAIQQLVWFDEELYSDTHSDFFHKRPTTYSKGLQSYGAGDLF